MKHAINSFPVQKLSLAKKTEEWRKACIDYVIGASDLMNSNELPDDEEIQRNYDLYNSLYDAKDLKYVTNPFNQEDGFPAMAQDYNIIRPKIDLLIGEETKRPFNFRVCRTSDIASGEIQDNAYSMLMNYAQAYVMSKMGPEERAQYEQAAQTGEIMTPEEIQSYLTKDYKDIVEITAYHSLNYLRNKLDIDHEFVKGWRDALIGGLEYYYVGVLNGEPYVEVVNPKEFKWAIGENTEFVHEADWCCRRMLMTAPQIYDRLYDKMDEKDLNELLEMIDGRPGKSTGFGPDAGKLDNFNPIATKIYSKLPSHNPFAAGIDEILVYHVCWKSYKKIGFVLTINPETGLPEEFQVDEFYKSNGSEINVEWKWIIEIWEGYRIGEELYVGMEPIEYQYIDESLNSQRLPYTGVIYSNANSKGKSLVNIMKPLQYMYIILWYRLELAIARDKGKVINVDITQIPKSMGIDPAKWLHYLSAVGVNFINPYEEGWDIPGREGGKAAAYNQMSSQDLSMSNTIVGYIQLMDKIEAMVGEISGVSAQRQGAISSNELVGNVERSVTQSAHITEPLFWMHNQVKKHVLIMLLNTAKSVWGKNDRKYLNYILDDTTRAFLELSDEFPYETFDVFITDSTKENMVIEQIKQLVQPAMQNGASIMDVIDILTTDNVSMLKQKMEEIDTTRQEREQAMFEREQQTQLQIEQLRAEISQQEIADKQADRDLKKYQIDVDNATRITVAELSAYRNAEVMDQDANGIADPIEIANQALEQQRINLEIGQKNLDVRLKLAEANNKQRLEQAKLRSQEKAEQNKSTIEKRKLALEEKKIKAAEKLQRMKDQAALEREKIKARTALKNRVSGENK